MKKQLKSEQGLTLIEILAATVISTMLILLIGNALIFGLKQYKNQSNKAQELTDVTYIAKIITKDIRKASKVKIENQSTLKLEIEKRLVVYEFDQEQLIIFKDGQELSRGIKTLTFSKLQNLLKIKIESIDENGKPEKIDTEIYIGQKVSF